MKSGKLRAIATSASSQIESLPDVPTLGQSGYPGYEMDVWFGAVAPAKTPQETASTLADWFTKALRAPEVRSKLALQGLSPIGVCGAQFGEFLRKRYEEYGRAIRNSNIKVD